MNLTISQKGLLLVSLPLLFQLTFIFLLARMQDRNAQAQEALGQRLFDVALLDLRLAREQGLDLLPALLRLARTRIENPEDPGSEP